VTEPSRRSAGLRAGPVVSFGTVSDSAAGLSGSRLTGGQQTVITAHRRLPCRVSACCRLANSRLSLSVCPAPCGCAEG
jgi:hypothetical protein